MDRGQAAMEFLMTYGWAILVVLVAVGAMTYFGAFDFSKILPNKYTLEGPLAAGQFKQNGSHLAFGFVNSAGRGMNITRINVSSMAGSDVTCNHQSSPGSLLGGGFDYQVVFTCAGVPGERLKANIWVEYRKEQESLTHQSHGLIQTRVEP